MDVLKINDDDDDDEVKLSFYIACDSVIKIPEFGFHFFRLKESLARQIQRC